MAYRVFLDSFASLDDLKPNERKEPEAVLAALRRVKRFSVWDMDNRALRNTICDLLESGRIIDDQKTEYPWVGVTFPDEIAGRIPASHTENDGEG